MWRLCQVSRNKSQNLATNALHQLEVQFSRVEQSLENGVIARNLGDEGRNHVNFLNCESALSRISINLPFLNYLYHLHFHFDFAIPEFRDNKIPKAEEGEATCEPLRG